MGNFREENRFLIFSAGIFGLYMYSLEAIVTKKRLLAFFTLWTKLPIFLIPAYILMDVRALIFDEMDVLKRLAMVRKVVLCSGYYLKNIVFYRERRRIEKLIDLWDDSFQDELFPEKHLISKEKTLKQNKRIVTGSIILAVTAVLSYTVPSFFSKKKEIRHPTGIIYAHRSPDFEIAVTFDLIASLSCISGVLFDCVLMVFLSLVHSKLDFLKETLADIIDEFVIDDEGRLLGRREGAQGNPQAAPSEYSECGEGQRRIFGQPQVGTYEERELDDEGFKKNVATIDAKLRIWIVHHQQLIAFFDNMSQVYSTVTSFQLGYIVLYTGLTALNIAKMKMSLIALSTTLVASSNLITLFYWCKLSGALKGIDVFGDGFSKAWFLLPKKVKTAFSLIIMRSKKPLSLYGLYLFAINLGTFCDVLKLTYQFFAFMMQFTQQET